MKEVDVTRGTQTFTGPSQGIVKAAARPPGDGGKELSSKDHWVVPGRSSAGKFLETLRPPNMAISAINGSYKCGCKAKIS